MADGALLQWLMLGAARRRRDGPASATTRCPHGAYAVVAEVRAKPGKENELREATLPLVAAVRREPNNLLYFLHEDRESPGHFVFYEIFASAADFDAHNATPHVQAWFAKTARTRRRRREGRSDGNSGQHMTATR